MKRLRSLTAAALLALAAGCHMDYSHNMGTLPTSAPAGPSLSTSVYSSGITSSAIVDGVVEGPDSRMWFTEPNQDSLGVSTPTGVIHQLALTAPSGFSCVVPQQIIVGPDQNLWSAAFCGEAIKVTTAGTVTMIPVNSSAQFTAIAAGPDGNLWLTDAASGAVVAISTAGTTLTTVPLATGAVPIAIVKGPDNNLWVVDAGLNQIDRITSGGSVTTYTSGIPSGLTVQGIVAASDGNLYASAASARTGVPDALLKVTTSGAITSAGTFSTSAAPANLIADGNGNLWIRETASGTNAVARFVLASSTLTEYPLQGVTAPNSPNDGQGDGTLWLAVGPSGQLWLGGTGAIYAAAMP